MLKRTKTTATAGRELVEAYRRGARLLRDCERAAATDVRQRHRRFGKNSVGKDIARRWAENLGVDERAILADAKFAEAVELIAANCNVTARRVISLACRWPNRKAIMELSRTSDVRQRYRIAGVAAGRFKSLKIAGDDPVFDTVSFSEIPSRLSRARGSLAACRRGLSGSISADVTTECVLLAKTCRSAAAKLLQFFSPRRPSPSAIPTSLSRDKVQPLLDRRIVRGKTVGLARAALKLTIKNLWDFPELQRRGIDAQPDESRKAIQDLHDIIKIAGLIVSPSKRWYQSRSRTGMIR
jgi:hypothetical protein